ncbi:MAG TPA: Mpo1-like protein [Pseudolabrys sp.]|nr:Mpo1-like protein [Pseudolabrys sp.]
MSTTFQRQLTDYVEYHRDPTNCALHVVGIVLLFLAAVLPLSLWPVTLFGLQTNIGLLLTIPVLIYWLILDVVLGVPLVAGAAVLLTAAAAISSHASVTAVWIITAVLLVIGVSAQIIGHQVFERRKPALLDNPPHLLMGPMFVMAKLFIAFGFRGDLAVIIQSDPALGRQAFYQHKGQGDARQD